MWNDGGIKDDGRKAGRGRDGFTLVEILIALTILSIGILGIVGLAGTAIKSSGSARGLTQATNAAQDRLEALLSVPYNNLEASDNTSRADLQRACAGPTGPVSRPVYTCTPTNQLTIGVAPDAKQYVWSYTVTLIDLDGNGTADSSDGLKRVDVSIDWLEQYSKTTKKTTLTTMRAKE
ncbi:MAG: prepilin-type N-terminal cleavage/methylation domain-containing protein [Deltaproteobacteria bacterium]|nr:prepilin-type N-terminal cleavage/methylation domain-containing protein [Deltaproteobacteria bacterium]